MPAKIKQRLVVNHHIWFIILLLSTFASIVNAERRTEIVDRTILRVCADPSNMPFSNKQGEGFENKIAELLAQSLGTELVYTWFPQSQGFVRATLNDYKCDVIMGISAAHSLVLNTNPYYQSIFSLIYRKDLGMEFSSIADESLKKLDRIGLIAGTSPTNLLLKYDLIDQLTPYHLYVDTRKVSSGAQMVQHILDGKLDAGILWGPIAGYHVSQHSSVIKYVPLVEDDSEENRIAFKVTMGVRRGEVEWKRALNKFIKHHSLEITAILVAYDVPIFNPK